MAEASCYVVVHYAAGLHPCVGDGGAYEFEAAFFEGCGDLFGEWGFGWDLAGGLEVVVDGFAAGEGPDPGGEVFAVGEHGLVDACAVDGGFDLGAGADDVCVLQEALRCPSR